MLAELAVNNEIDTLLAEIDEFNIKSFSDLYRAALVRALRFVVNDGTPGDLLTFPEWFYVDNDTTKQMKVEYTFNPKYSDSQLK